MLRAREPGFIATKFDAGRYSVGPDMGQVNATSSRTSIDRFSVILVAVAATLWVSDAYFRNQLIKHLSSTQIVVAEDALIALFLLPVLIRSRHEVRGLGTRGWIAVGLIAVGAQSLATIMFTASFSYHNYAETLVLQQVQPLIAIGQHGTAFHRHGHLPVHPVSALDNDLGSLPGLIDLAALEHLLQ